MSSYRRRLWTMRCYNTLPREVWACKRSVRRLRSEAEDSEHAQTRSSKMEADWHELHKLRAVLAEFAKTASPKEVEAAQERLAALMREADLVLERGVAKGGGGADDTLFAEQPPMRR